MLPIKNVFLIAILQITHTLFPLNMASVYKYAPLASKLFGTVGAAAALQYNNYCLCDSDNREEQKKKFAAQWQASIRPEQADAIAKKIWQNEAGGREDLLVWWSSHESFPSLGIGHCIWFPKGKTFAYNDTFPELCRYLKEHKVLLPTWLEDSIKTGAPWKDREEFLQDTARTEELRKLLVSTVDLQTKFMIGRCGERLFGVMEQAPVRKKDKVQEYLKMLQQSAVGTYVIVDYVNFKGAGLTEDPTKPPPKWGLLQVLDTMPDDVTQENVNKAFAVAAAEVLLKRIKDSDYKDGRWMGIWMRRVVSYDGVDKTALPQNT